MNPIDPEVIVRDQIKATQTLIKLFRQMPPGDERDRLAVNIHRLMENHKEAISLMRDPGKMH